MKHLFFILVLAFSQFAYSSESIYEDAIKHFIKKSPTSYNNNLVFEYNSIFERGNIPSIIKGCNVTSEKSIKEYLNKCKNGFVTIYTIEKINFCETCIDPFSIKIKEWNIIKEDGNKFTFTQSRICTVSYTYNCKKKRFKYKLIDYNEGDWGPSHDEQEARWKGWID